jgi:hypothetical protein
MLRKEFSMTRRLVLMVSLLVPLVAGAQEEKEAKPVEAAKSEDGVWSLAGQTWDFSAIGTVYAPVKGSLDAKTGAAEWTLELVKDLTPAEATTQGAVAGSPFKPAFLDGEKLLLAGDARVKITPISGKLGDRVRMTVVLPKAEILAKAKLVRVGRRTELGF